MVGLTSEGKNRLSKIADYIITTISEETIFRSESASTRLAQLAVMDSLIAIVAFQDYDKSFQAIYKTRASTSGQQGLTAGNKRTVQLEIRRGISLFD